MNSKSQWAFEDLVPGVCIELPAYEVTEAEILAFARQYDPQYFHTDPVAARQSLFGGLIASGWMTTGIFMRMQCDAFLLDSTCMGSPGVDEIRWLHPVRPGDVLRGESRVTEARPSRSRPDRGAVFSDVSIHNQRGEVVMTLRSRAIFARREAP
ncbi:MaoC family dehydratase [Kineobactrum salinum]|uniref:MaoC family dehydratase n=1 Tax=Kineobactrum salinum TaxID=2708301 RepID=A0A6C0TWI9_9GAMM|nr:MaoC family dehydratase [Kineobactrum salinum]QIB64180.1 MaoC family dehydratase [Kineobactrum salinum]